MPPARIAQNEPERIAALHGLGILDTPPDERFDRITRTAKRLFGVEIVLISLVDVNRQWFKSCIGLPERETPRAISFCAHAILSDDILVIPDAREDPRVATNSNVTGPPYIRFYAGKPLRGPSGHNLGTLCVVDTSPREFSQEDRAALADLAAIAEAEFEAVLLREAVVDLHVAEAQLRAIMDGAAEGIGMIDADGVVAYINRAAAASLGYSTEELAGRQFHDVVHYARADGSPYPAEECPMHTTLTTGAAVRQADEVFWRKDGRPLPIEYTSTAIRDGDAIKGAVVTWSDISERRELDRMKDEFVSSVSHELRTPLTSIKGYVELMLDGDAGELGEEQRAFLNVVARNTARLNSLISDLLTMSRLRSGQVTVERAAVELSAVATHVVEELMPVAEEKGVELAGELAPAWITGDARQLTQAVANLVSNAIKFTSASGHVLIRSAVRNGHALLEVVDDGVGVPEDELGQVGTRFFRASTAGETEGTGLGLAITREIVAAHNGSLEVESAPGEGSTFRLRLPAVSAAEAP